MASIHCRLLTNTYYRPWPEHLLTTAKIEVCMHAQLTTKGVDHSCSLDTCTCATINSTSINLGRDRKCVHQTNGTLGPH